MSKFSLWHIFKSFSWQISAQPTFSEKSPILTPINWKFWLGLLQLDGNSCLDSYSYTIIQAQVGYSFRHGHNISPVLSPRQSTKRFCTRFEQQKSARHHNCLPVGQNVFVFLWSRGNLFCHAYMTKKKNKNMLLELWSKLQRYGTERVAQASKMCRLLCGLGEARDSFPVC